MERNRSTTATGEPFTPAIVEATWRKASMVNGEDPTQFRRDVCGAGIRKASYGTTGEHAWEIDHIKPVSKGGTDHRTNLQPLHWSNNHTKGDDDELVCKKKF